MDFTTANKFVYDAYEYLIAAKRCTTCIHAIDRPSDGGYPIFRTQCTLKNEDRTGCSGRCCSDYKAIENPHKILMDLDKLK